MPLHDSFYTGPGRGPLEPVSFPEYPVHPQCGNCGRRTRVNVAYCNSAFCQLMAQRRYREAQTLRAASKEEKGNGE